MCKTNLLIVCSNNGEVSYLNTKEPVGKMTVLQLKQYAVNTFPKSGPTVNDIRLIVQDQPLDNDSAPLSEYNIKSHAKVQMVRKVNGG